MPRKNLFTPGALRNRVTIEDVKGQSDEQGGQTNEVPVAIIEVWAAIQPLAGSELFFAQGIQSNTSHRVVMRYPGDDVVKQEMRVVHKNRVLEILSITNVDEKNEWLELMCTESGVPS